MSDLERIRPDLILGRRAPAVAPELAAARKVWTEVVGAAAARHSHPARVTGGALVVACASAAWAGELAMLKSRIRAGLRTATGADLDVRFEVADVPGEPTS